LATVDSIPFLFLSSIQVQFYSFSLELGLWTLVLILLLISSALVSGSEVAFYSLNPSDLEKIKKRRSKRTSKVIGLLQRPEHLLGTILISNNLVNIGIVILAAFITNSLVDFTQAKTLGFLIQVVLITFLLLLFGEILPKLYANLHRIKFSTFMAPSLSVLGIVFKPLVFIMVNSTSLVQKRMAKQKAKISMDELSDALDLPATKISEDKQILKGIAKFRNIDAKEIMKSRLDIFAINISTPFSGLLQKILDSGYSRIPIYYQSIDQIQGVLYIKDLLPHLHKKASFKWQSLIRPPYYVPESKKINDLLEEFQAKKIHMTIVIDEYGGTSGIVTLEDILEEIVGEITDEFDEEENYYRKIDDRTYLFEGKTLLNDFFKIFNKPDNLFDEIKGDADTLAGLILEIKGDIPSKGDVFNIKGFNFEVKSVDNRRIKQVKVVNNHDSSDKK